MKEIKILNVPKSEFQRVYGTDFKRVETMLEKRTAEGWEIVSICPCDAVNNLDAGFLVVLQREKYRSST